MPAEDRRREGVETDGCARVAVPPRRGGRNVTQERRRPCGGGDPGGAHRAAHGPGAEACCRLERYDPDVAVAGRSSNERPLWACPRCGRTFAQLNQTHTCAPLGALDARFQRCEPGVRETFDRVVAAVSAIGPVDVLPERTRIALHVRMSFAAFVPRVRWLDGHVILARRLDSPRFRRIEVYSPRNVLHAFRLAAPDEVDDEVVGWLSEAYAVGEQRHHVRAERPDVDPPAAVARGVGATPRSAR